MSTPCIGWADARDAIQLAAASDSDVLVVGLLGPDRSPVIMLVVDNCPCARDDVLFVLDFVLAATAESPLEAIVLGTRGETLAPSDELDLWLLLGCVCREWGVALLDWFVINDDLCYSVPGLWDEQPSW